MRKGLPSKTAQSVAIRRAEHQFYDYPPVFADPVALRILGPDAVTSIWLRWPLAYLPGARHLRAFVAVRSRYAEDQLARAVAAGTRQCVILGAGLDTFAYRNPYAPAVLQVFEVDHPDTQALKRQRLTEAGIAIPEGLRFVPVDFEREDLRTKLEAAGFRPGEPAFFSWLGCTPYLKPGAVMETLTLIHRLCPDNMVVFDYAAPPQNFSGAERIAFDILEQRVRRAGEPFRGFFDPEALVTALKEIGYRRVERPSTAQINALYFGNRFDGLAIRGRLGGLVCAY